MNNNYWEKYRPKQTILPTNLDSVYTRYLRPDKFFSYINDISNNCAKVLRVARWIGFDIEINSMGEIMTIGIFSTYTYPIFITFDKNFSIPINLKSVLEDNTVIKICFNTDDAYRILTGFFGVNANSVMTVYKPKENNIL